MKQYKNPTVIEEFRKRFPRVSEMFTAPAKGELTDIEQFLDEQLTKKEEEIATKIENIVKFWKHSEELIDWEGVAFDVENLIEELKTKK